jgi:hydrogenase maturation protease
MGPTALIVAVGDPEVGSDAAGPMILAEVLKKGLPPNVTAHSVGRRPDRLPDLVARTKADGIRPSLLLILDAVTSSTEPPGTLVERPITRVRGVPPGLSSHAASLREALGLLHLQLGRNAPARIVLLGVVVGSEADGPLQSAATHAIPRAAEWAREILERPMSSPGDVARNEAPRG